MERLEFLLVVMGYVMGTGCKPEDLIIEVDRMLTERNAPCMSSEEKKQLIEKLDSLVYWMTLLAGNRAARRAVDKHAEKHQI